MSLERIVKQFEDHTLRITTIDGEPWFLAKDVCEVLGYANASDSIKKHCKAGGIAKRDTPTSSANQQITFINEANLYRLITRSRMPNSEKFTDWVTEEVLPSIRKNGAYITPEKWEEIQNDPRRMAKLYTDLADSQDKMKAAKKEIEALSVTITSQVLEIAENAPKVEYHDKVLMSDGLMTVSEIACDLDTTAQKLNLFLHKHGVIHHSGKTWVASAKFLGNKFFDYHTYLYKDSKGKEISRNHMKVTQQGRKFITELWESAHSNNKLAVSF
jgi:anti-repressor protein